MPGISYDESGSLASYFGVTCLGLILIPATFYTLRTEPTGESRVGVHLCRPLTLSFPLYPDTWPSSTLVHRRLLFIVIAVLFITIAPAFFAQQTLPSKPFAHVPNVATTLFE